MAHHIILCAFGTTTQSRLTYDHLHTVIERQFPESRIHWYYSSPTVRRAIRKDAPQQPESLVSILDLIEAEAPSNIVVQSMHVLPGQEFHRIVRESRQRTPYPAIGMPLLNTPGDYHDVAECLAHLVPEDKHTALLVLGHGTRHPSWTAYPALEKVLRVRFGGRAFVAGLEHYPVSDTVIDEIRASGYTHVRVVPFLMVAGMHFQRDIEGEHPDSWKARLSRSGIGLSIHDSGLGMLPGIGEIFCNHIREAPHPANMGPGAK
jgi:sirohydrochlorin cobaltochelatase